MLVAIFPYHDMPGNAVHNGVIDNSLTLAQHNGHCCPSREHDTQIRQTKCPGHSVFPGVVLLALAPSLSLACGGDSSASGNMISSMIQRLTKIIPSHSHGDDMDQQSTAHVLLLVSM